VQLTFVKCGCTESVDYSVVLAYHALLFICGTIVDPMSIDYVNIARMSPHFTHFVELAITKARKLLFQCIVIQLISLKNQQLSLNH
jgi:hypothetical protein